MKGVVSLFLGIFGTFAFSWLGLAVIPNMQIGHLDPQTDEDGNDPYPAPKSGMAERGRQIYAANGCIYCHSQQVRADYAASDIERKWGDRRSAPRDYIFEHPAQLGKMRLGPDLANVGHRTPASDESAPATSAPTAAAPASTTAANSASAAAPAAATEAPAAPAAPIAKAPAAVASTAVAATVTEVAGGAASSAPVVSPTGAPAESTEIGKDGKPIPYTASWHHRHLYAPRSVAVDSIMPSYRFLYEQRRVNGQRAADAVVFTGPGAPKEGWEIVPSYDAKCLVAYLMSLDQSHALKEVRATTPASPAAPGKAVK